MTASHPLRPTSAWSHLALLTALATAFALAVPLAGSAAGQEREVTELDAEDNVAAALAWSQHAFTEAEHAGLGRDDTFPDNLASGMIQGTMAAPLLLTVTDELDDRVTAELERLGVSTVHLLGGTQAISAEVETELTQLGYAIIRHAGATRIETAIDIAGVHAPDADHALVTRAFGTPDGDETQAWADALAGGAWAAELGDPVLFTQAEVLTGATRAYIEQSEIERVTILGGVAAVSPVVEAELLSMGLEVERVSGTNRFATATEVASERGYVDAGDVPTNGTIVLVEGQAADAWASGFAAAGFAGLEPAPLVLANQESVPPETTAWLEHTSSHPVELVCGPYTQSTACQEAAETLGLPVAAPDAPMATDAPELISATTVRTTNEAATVRFTFDDPIAAGAVTPERFLLYGPDTSDKRYLSGSQTVRDPDDSSSVLAVFDRNDWEFATVAASEFGAVSNIQGQLSPEGWRPLKSTQFPPGVTDAPDLLNVSQFTDSNGDVAVTYTFNQGVASTGTAAQFGLVLVDGTEVTADSVGAPSAATVEVQFSAATIEAAGADDAADLQSQTRRAFVMTAAVSNAAGDENPQQAVNVADDGRTETPDLVSVTLNSGDDTADYQFTDTLVATGASAGAFRIYYENASEVPGTGDVTIADDTVTVQFPEGAVHGLVVGATVDSEAVVSFDTGSANAVDDIVLSPSFAAGQTLGPRLEDVGIEDSVVVEDPITEEQTVTTFEVTFTFDRSVATTEAGAFVLYTEGATRFDIEDDLAGQCEADAEAVVCAVSAEGIDADDFDAARNAALGTVEYNAVVNATGFTTGLDDPIAFPNHEAGAAI